MTGGRGALPYDAIRREIEAQFSLDLLSIHGPSHWARVERLGLRLAETSGADPEVVRLFALFHDARRENEHTDPGHGARGAELAREWRGRAFDLPEAAFRKLVVACRDHTEGERSDDATIGTCWDADRLDLARLGMRPRGELLSTPAARAPDIQAWAWELSWGADEEG